MRIENNYHVAYVIDLKYYHIYQQQQQNCSKKCCEIFFPIDSTNE